MNYVEEFYSIEINFSDKSTLFLTKKNNTIKKKKKMF